MPKRETGKAEGTEPIAPILAVRKSASSGRPSAGINRHGGVSSEGWRIQWEPVPPG
jgi:hypothetical protein